MSYEFSTTSPKSFRPKKPWLVVGRWVGAIGLAAGTAVVLMPGTGTAAPSTSSTPPVITLTQVQSQLSTLAVTANTSGKAVLSDAVTQLSGALAPSLWADFDDANFPVPPPYGVTVFISTEAAVEDLLSITSNPTISRAALVEAGDAILDADQDITDNALNEAALPYSQNGSPFGPGASSQIATYESQWTNAYKVLGDQVEGAATSVPEPTINQAAEYYLESPIALLDFAPQSASGPELTANGKPEVFYFGSEGCPYCAVDRWSMVLALSQFGRFSPLALNVSDSYDVYPGTNTFTFYGSTYSSPYLSFVPVEGFTNQPAPSSAPGGPGGVCDAPNQKWSTLQELSSQQQALMAEYNSNCSFPFLDVANEWTTIGSYSDPSVIEGMSWQQITSALANPSSAAAQAVEGGAVLLTAEICEATSGQPGRVCDSSIVQQYETQIL
jgi:hypothetical protein